MQRATTFMDEKSHLTKFRIKVMVLLPCNDLCATDMSVHSGFAHSVQHENGPISLCSAESKLLHVTL